MHLPTWLYHAEKEPKLFNTEEQVKEAFKSGWVDHPSKVSEQVQACPVVQINEEIKEKDFTSMSVKELKAELIEKGHSEEELKGLKKDELILKLGQA